MNMHCFLSYVKISKTDKITSLYSEPRNILKATGNFPDVFPDSDVYVKSLYPISGGDATIILSQNTYLLLTNNISVVQ